MKAYINKINLFIPFTLIVGTILRVAHLFFIDMSSPFRFGGLFLEFSYQIIKSNFKLPVIIPFFTDGGIPFAYPPLPFYIQAIIIKLTGLPDYWVTNILPPLFAVITLPLFYAFTRTLNFSKLTQYISLLIFAIYPIAIRDQIEAGGLAEAAGSVAMLLFFIAIIRFLREQSISNYVYASVALALCVVSSPGSAYAAAIIITLLFIKKLILSIINKNKLAVLPRLIIVGCAAAALSAPYWFGVIKHHGVSLFISSFLGQHASIISTFSKLIVNLIFNSVGGPKPIILEVLLLWSLILLIVKRRWNYLLWYLVMLGIPREGIWLSSIPAAIIIGLNLGELNTFILESNFVERFNLQIACKVTFIVIIIPALTFNSVLMVRDMVINDKYIVSRDSIEGLKWMNDNLPANAKLIVIGNAGLGDWVPQIARRDVVNTEFGAEWEKEELEQISIINSRIREAETYSGVVEIVQEYYSDYNLYYFFENNVDNYFDINAAEFEENDGKRLWHKGAITIGVLSLK